MLPLKHAKHAAPKCFTVSQRLKPGTKLVQQFYLSSLYCSFPGFNWSDCIKHCFNVNGYLQVAIYDVTVLGT